MSNPDNLEARQARTIHDRNRTNDQGIIDPERQDHRDHSRAYVRSEPLQYVSDTAIRLSSRTRIVSRKREDQSRTQGSQSQGQGIGQTDRREKTSQAPTVGQGENLGQGLGKTSRRIACQRLRHA